MKNICLSILALAALSSATFANNRNYDLRDSDTYFGKYSTQLKDKVAKKANTMTVISPLAVEGKAFGLTNFERMTIRSRENDQGGH